MFSNHFHTPISKIIFKKYKKYLNIFLIKNTLKNNYNNSIIILCLSRERISNSQSTIHGKKKATSSQ